MSHDWYQENVFGDLLEWSPTERLHTRSPDVVSGHMSRSVWRTKSAGLISGRTLLVVYRDDSIFDFFKDRLGDDFP